MRNVLSYEERDIGFVIYIESGGALRLFNTFDYNTSWGVKLYVTVFRHNIYTPSEQDDYISTYRDLYIFSTLLNGPKEYVFQKTTEMFYDTIHELPSEKTQIDFGEADNFKFGRRVITRLYNGTICVVYYADVESYKQIIIKYSNDNGSTWVGETIISTLEGMSTGSQTNPSIAISSNGVIHVVFKSYFEEVGYGIYYSNYTTEWSVPFLISTFVNMTLYPQEIPVIAVDEDDNLHVSWYGLTDDYSIGDYQIWYVNKTSSWSYPLRLSTLATMNTRPQWNPSITVDSQNMPNVVWTGTTTDYNEVKLQVYHTYYNGSWTEPFRVSVYTGMDEGGTYEVSIASGYDNSTHIAFGGKTVAGGGGKLWYSKFSDKIWSYPLKISTNAGMGVVGKNQYGPTIAVYPLKKIDIIWVGKSTSQAVNVVIWLKSYNNVTGWGDVILLQDDAPLLRTPNLRYSRYPLQYVAYVAKDENGTTISPTYPTIPEVEEWINNYLSHSGGQTSRQKDAMGDTILSLMGLSGFIMIPLSFWLFMANMHSDLENAFYLLMVVFIMGLAFVITWLWA